MYEISTAHITDDYVHDRLAQVKTHELMVLSRIPKAATTRVLSSGSTQDG